MAVVVRSRHDPRMRAYVERRSQKSLSKTEIICCLKRCLAREVFRTLRANLRGYRDLTVPWEHHGRLPATEPVEHVQVLE